MSQMKMSPESYLKRNIHGGPGELKQYLIENGVEPEKLETIDKDIVYYVGIIRRHNVREVMSLFYIYRMSIVEIRWKTDIIYSRVEKYLEAGKREILEFIKEERK